MTDTVARIIERPAHVSVLPIYRQPLGDQRCVWHLSSGAMILDFKRPADRPHSCRYELLSPAPELWGGMMYHGGADTFAKALRMAQPS